MRKTSSSGSPISVSVYDRTRVDAWQWFAAPPEANTYGYVESLLRIGVAQRIHRWDWALELAQPAVLDAPEQRRFSCHRAGSVGPGRHVLCIQHELLSGGGVSSSRAMCAMTARDTNLRVGRFEFFDGQETKPKNPTIGWLQNNRIAHRLIGNFGFSNAQRSFDGIDGSL